MPIGWCVATIMDVATSSGGGTPSKSDASYWTDGTLPWVSPKDMKVFLITSSEDQVTTRALERLTLIPANSILVVVRSGILSRTLPVAINQISVTVNQDMRAFVPKTGVNARYIAWQLISRERDILDSCAKDGTTVASIEGPALAAYPLAIAPLAEQTRIVEKLEELLSDLDAGVAELKAAQCKLAQYRQSLLKAAVEGTLTADWRAAQYNYDHHSLSSSPRKRGSIGSAHRVMDASFRGNDRQNETGADLLQRILTERRARWETRQLAKFAEQGKTTPKGWHDKYKEPVAPDATDLPALPDGWVWSTLDQLTEFITSGSRGWAAYYADDGATFIRSQNINKDWLDLADTAYVNPPENSEGARTRVDLGDLLLTITGANVGKAAWVDVELEEAYVSQHVALIRLVETALCSYLHLYLTAVAGGRGQLNEEAYGAGKPGLNLQQVAAVRVPLPSYIELVRLMEEVATQLHATITQHGVIEHAIKQSVAQRKNILKAAFAGQLVPQDPNDEPASALLERIRAERVAGGAKGAHKAVRKRKELA
jgi:type I restriction enzyme S subunit